MTSNPVQPETFGPYRILGTLGHGGMGVVYRAEHAATGERVALKTVRLADQAMLSSIRREIHALRRLDHPGVVRIVGEGLCEGLPWYAMELLEGRTLHADNQGLAGDGATVAVATTQAAAPDAATAELASGAVSGPAGGGAEGVVRGGSSGRRGSLMEALTVLRAVCEALSFVHGMGLVHRDLKPENIFIRRGGLPVLVDFGLALAAGGATGRDVLEVTGRPMGSPAYMAPEQIRGDLIDARADLYALGVMLYEVVTGTVPFTGTVPMVIAQQIHKQPVPPSQITGVPAALEELILRLLEKHPRDRLGYADDVARSLAKLGAAAPEGWPRGKPYLYRPGLAGRAGALADVERSLSRTAQNKGARVFVGGESGVGKTRFATEIATLATKRGLRVVAGECAAVAVGEGRGEVKAAPLHPLRPLLQAIADRCRELGREETDRVLGDRAPVLAAYEPAIQRLPGREQMPELPPLQPQAARARLVSALVETLAEAARAEPTLLLIDDLQWADENSLAFLKALDAAFFERAPLVLLGTYRAEENSDALRELLDAEGAARVELGRLDGPAVGRMVSDMIAVTAPPAAFIDFLEQQSEGNPFFIAEYLRVAIDEGVLARDASGAWQVHKQEDRDTYREAIPLPRELRALVGRRVSALGAGARALARVAAVLGREFDADVLSAATTLDELPGLEAIEELRERQILDVSGGRLRFAHDKLRELIYEEIPADQCRALSGVAARAIEARYGGTPEIAAYYPVLAHHFAAAGEDGKAIEYLERAGARALATGASTEARAFLRRLVDLDDQRRRRGDEPAGASQRASWERQLAQAEFNLGHLRDAERLLLGVLHRLRTGRPRDPGAGKGSALVALLVLIGHLLRQLYHLFGPARRPSADPAARRALTEAALATERLSEIYFFQSEPLLSFSAALQSANHAEGLGPSPELSRSYATLSVAFGLVPWQRVVDAYASRAVAAADATADADAVSWVHFLKALNAVGTARWGDARGSLDKTVTLARAVQDHRRTEEALALRGNVELMAGEIQEAIAVYDELHASAKKSGNRQGEVWGLTGKMEALMILGRAGEALAYMERAQALMKDDSGDESERITRGEAAFAYLMAGDRVRALRIAADTLSLIERTSPSAFHLLNGYAATGEVFFTLLAGAGEGEREDLRRSCKSICRAMKSYARIFPIGAPYAHRFHGALRALSGDLRGGERAFLRSLADAERLGMPLEAGIAHYEIGRFLPAGDPRRAEHLDRARAAFAALGAGFWGARVEAALGSADPPRLAA